MNISYGKQSLDQGDIDSVVKVLKGDWLTQGKAVEKFENDLNRYFGSQIFLCCFEWYCSFAFDWTLPRLERK